MISDSESEAFGFQIRRVDITGQSQFSMDELSAIAKPIGNETVIIKFNSERYDIRAAINNISARVLAAEDTIYWELNSKKFSLLTPPFENIKSEVLSNSNSDARLLKLAIEQIFSGYKNHYAINDRLTACSIESAYGNWAYTLQKTDESSTGIVIRFNEIMCGAAISKISDAGVEVLLAGVTEAFRGTGMYKFLISEIISNLDKRMPLKISTQSGNIAVQRNWTDLGFKPKYSISTLHLQN